MKEMSMIKLTYNTKQSSEVVGTLLSECSLLGYPSLELAIEPIAYKKSAENTAISLSIDLQHTSIGYPEILTRLSSFTAKLAELDKDKPEFEKIVGAVRAL